jgi:NAD(P)-dependent dehydrogenase (short-subunit alcohol dehydrogenase family)
MPGVDVLDASLDVADKASVVAAAAAFEAQFGRLDVLVNNAAAYVDWTETAMGADLDEAHRVMEVNLFGPWQVAQAFLPLLQRSEHPRLVNVSSGGGSHADHRFGLTTRHGAAASYGVTKAALNALTATLAAELAETPVVVNAVCPGLTATWPGAEQMGARPVVASAQSVIWAVMLPDDGPRGGFFRDGQPLGW